MIFKTFSAKIKGAFPISTGDQTPIDQTITFSKRRILLKPEQFERIYLDPMLVQLVVDKAEYDFDKLLNKKDEKQFSIILKSRLNNLDDGVHHLDISTWNKIRANIIHHRYWVDREKEWFFKTLISTLIGFLFGLMGAYLGYRLGIRSAQKAKIEIAPIKEIPVKK